MSPFTFTRAVFLAIVLCFSIISASASSLRSRPIKRLEHPSTLAIEILPRKATQLFGKRSVLADSPILQHSDTFRLKLFAFGDTFYLHLRPNDHLVHPAARINYYTTLSNGQSVLSHTEPLLRESVKAYWGEVVHAEATPERLREDAAGVLPRPSGKSELGWARIMVHHQGDTEAGLAPSFEGAFSVNGMVHHVMTKDNYLRNKHSLDPHITISAADPDASLVIWRDSDIMPLDEEAAALSGSVIGDETPARPPTCAHESVSFNTDPIQNPALRGPSKQPVTPWYDPLAFWGLSGSGLARRDDVANGNMSSNFEDYIGSNAGCPSTQKIVYMGVAADCEYVSQYGSRENATQQILTNWNSASALYKSTFNVSLGIIELQVQDTTCPSTPNASAPWDLACSTNTTLDSRLSIFSGWRGEKANDGAGLWHLMSGCPTGSEVGIAYVATLCQQSATGKAPSIVSGTAVSTAGMTEWQVVSHEIGHNFGAIHDCTDGCPSNGINCCPFTSSSCNANGKFVMNPVTEAGEMQFSPCSLGNICSLMLGDPGEMTNTSCLVDPNTSIKTISLQMCGNGIVEEGEDCDPGQGINSTCCDSQTCKFTTGAVCDPTSSPCCTGKCSFSPSTQVCRPAKDTQCDTAEMCTGNSSECPPDVVAPDGKSCGSNGLACASGQCTSLNLQCQTLGSSLNLQSACPSQDEKSCQVSCQDPSNSGQCVVLQSQLINGSPCGYGGKCYSGSCKAGSVWDTIKAWYRQNLQIAIPVTVVAGVFVLFIIFMIWRCCCYGRGGKDSFRKGAAPTFEPALAGTRGKRIRSWPNGTAAGPPAPDLLGGPSSILPNLGTAPRSPRAPHSPPDILVRNRSGSLWRLTATSAAGATGRRVARARATTGRSSRPDLCATVTVRADNQIGLFLPIGWTRHRTTARPDFGSASWLALPLRLLYIWPYPRDVYSCYLLYDIGGGRGASGCLINTIHRVRQVIAVVRIITNRSGQSTLHKGEWLVVINV
ncbi:hypothetical protein CERSUDRAFT_101854 [Gelatoporia subvermispora B]|uniref:Disintegrin and metalloproteinase domain-containing protein B n=1 Tax=Ceriporiopsis subvermispora (strain B) TaxID=914234 RepID=M2PX09_CERS8|nr:hypothetical protein CERSUDRAFT_101854 [Gelatoporia subvermispora B]